MQVLLPVLAISVLLLVVTVSVPIAARLRVPHTVLLAAIGVLIGGSSLIAGSFVQTGIFGDVLIGLNELNIGAPAMMLIFLPPLLFVAGLNIDVRRLLDDVWAVLLLAVVAVVICAFAVGGAVSWAGGLPLLPCLLLGAVVATTDPAAVVSIFRDIGAPGRLTILIQGESVLNDAAAIALFGLIIGLLLGTSEVDATGAVLQFGIGLAGGLLLGYLAARLTCLMLRRLNGALVAELTCTVALAYLVYIVGEFYSRASGVTAVVSAALTIAAYGPLNLHPRNWDLLKTLWDQIDFWASSLIILIASLIAARILTYASFTELGLLIVLIVAALAARATVLWGLLPLLSALGLTVKVEQRHRLVILWGGLRGAVTMVLAIAVSDNLLLEPETRELVSILAIGFVLFTLFVSAPLLQPLLRILKLNELGPVDRALRDRVLLISRESVRDRVEEVAEQYGLSREVQQYLEDPPERAEVSTDHLPREDLVRVGLITLATRERALYLQHFAERTVSRRLNALLVAGAERLLDRVRLEGATGYRDWARRSTDYPRRLRIALFLNRQLGSVMPLAKQLEDRFEILLISQLVLRELRLFNRSAVRPVIGLEPSDEIVEILTERLENVQRALTAMRLQYPDYADALARRHLETTRLRLEEGDYDRMREEALISREVHDSLLAELRDRRTTLDRRPPLDLGLRIREMIERSPLFDKLEPARLTRLAKLLRPVLVAPGERIVRRGERGHAMYFIVSGVVEAMLPTGPVRMSTGDFFGEMALMLNRTRTADVVAVGFCQLLLLEKRDLQLLSRLDPVLRRRLREVAEERQKQHDAAEAASITGDAGEARALEKPEPAA